MNIGLLFLSIILIVLGGVFGFIPLIIIGFFLLIPALRSAKKAKTAPSEARPRTSAPTVSTPPTPTVSTPHPQHPAPQQAMPPATTNPPIPEHGPTSALFPAPVLPALNPVSYPHQAAAVSPKEDLSEIIEIAAVMALVRLLSKRRAQGT